MRTALQVAAVILTGLAMVPALAHALEYPGKLRLTREHYRAMQRVYYPGFTIAGAAEPLAILVLAASLAASPAESTAFWLTAGALAAAALTHLIYWVATAPVNKVWLRGQELSGSADRFFGAGGDVGADEDWTMLRDRWERSHLWRTGIAAAAFVLATLALASGD